MLVLRGRRKRYNVQYLCCIFYELIKPLNLQYFKKIRSLKYSKDVRVSCNGNFQRHAGI
jgi:hypothetical protein